MDYEKLNQILSDIESLKRDDKITRDGLDDHFDNLGLGNEEKKWLHIQSIDLFSKSEKDKIEEERKCMVYIIASLFLIVTLLIFFYGGYYGEAKFYFVLAMLLVFLGIKRVWKPKSEEIDIDIIQKKEYESNRKIKRRF